MKIKWNGLFLIVLAIVSTLSLAKESSEAKLDIVKGKKAKAVIVYPKDKELYAITAARLSDYIQYLTDVKLPMVPEVNFKSAANVTAILLDGTKEKNLLTKVGIEIKVDSDRTDAYVIRSVLHNEKPVVVLAANSPEGVKFAAYRLMEELDIEGTNAAVKIMNIEAEPFINTRVISMFNIWRCPVDIQRKYNIEAWPAEKLDDYIDMWDSLGFNAIETHDRFNEIYLAPTYGITRKDWRQKVAVMSDRAHHNGQKVFLRAWGNAVMDVPEGFKLESPNTIVPKIITTFCPDLPNDRKRWETEIKDYYVKNYARHIDHFIGHWCDAGGCQDPASKATIKDAMALHMELQNAFREFNPAIETSFNFWNMGSHCWREYKDHRSVSAAGVLSKDVILAQITRSTNKLYSEQMTEDFIKDGHRAAVWTWIQGDTESFANNASLQARVNHLGNYFNNLPDSARLLEWHNVEICQHGLGNLMNFYVAGKLMWDKDADANNLALDFARKVFGPGNDTLYVSAYNMLEEARYFTNKFPPLEISNPSQMASMCHGAVNNLKRVKIDKSFRPRLRLIVTPDQMLKDLSDALKVNEEFYDCFAHDLSALKKAVENGDKARQETLIAAIKVKTESWDDSVGGMLEARKMEREVERLLKPKK